MPSIIADFLVTPEKELRVTKNLLKYSLVGLGIVLGTCAVAHGLAFAKKHEIDPSLAVSALTLLAGVDCSFARSAQEVDGNIL